MNRQSLASVYSLNNASPRDFLDSALSVPLSIAPMPQVAAQLAELASTESTDAAQYARVVQTDASLAGEIIRVANSPVLRARSPIVSLQQAISWLGIGEVRNIAMAILVRGEVFTAPGHEPEAEDLWREAWFAGLWAKEIARMRRKHVESAYLAALMHRTGAALALRVLSRFEMEQRTAMDVRSFGDLIAEYDASFGRALMQGWQIPVDVQTAATDWRDYRNSKQADLAATVHGAHVLAAHTLHPQLLVEEIVLESPAFEHLGVFPDERKLLIAKREQIRMLAGI